jgi:hypothetical protein
MDSVHTHAFWEQTLAALRAGGKTIIVCARAIILLWAEEETKLGQLPAKSGSILEAVLYRGEMPRGDAAAIVGTGDRQARRVVSALLDNEVLASDSLRAPLRLAFPATLA